MAKKKAPKLCRPYLPLPEATAARLHDIARTVDRPPRVVVRRVIDKIYERLASGEPSATVFEQVGL